MSGSLGLLSREGSGTRSDLSRLREQFLSNSVAELAGVRPVIARSWYRSRAAGVDASRDRGVLDAGRVDGPTLQAAEPHLRKLDEIAADMGGYVSLTAPNGALVHPRFLRDAEGFPEGYSLLEEHCGSNGEGLALEEGRGVWLAPEEHFREDMRGNWCFGSLIRDPLHSRIRAVVGLTFPAERVSGMDPASTLLMLEGVTARIEREIEARTSTRERTLLTEYLTASRRRGNTAVVATDGKNSLMNAAAMSSLAEGDLAIVASYAKEVMASARPAQCEVNLRGPGPVTLDISPVQLTLTNVGAVVAIVRSHREPAGGGAADAVLLRAGAGAVEPGSDALARRFDVASLEFQRTLQVARKAIAQSRSVAIAGEAGTGKRRLARAIADERGETVAFDCESVAPGALAFSETLRRAVETGASTFVVEHADSLARPQALELIRSLKGSATTIVAMTFVRPTDLTLLISEAFDVLEIPVAPLRNRREDIAALANAFAEELGARRLSRRLLTSLADSDWPGNAEQLRAVVSNAVERAQGAEVTVDDLPQGFHRLMTNGRLSRLEDAELSELRNALKEADGNRTLAAEMLQIGRSTLYRRMDYFRGRGFEL